jgi:hypothetical protein
MIIGNEYLHGSPVPLHLTAFYLFFHRVLFPVEQTQMDLPL